MSADARRSARDGTRAVPASFSAHAASDEIVRDVHAALSAEQWSTAVHLVGLHWSLLLDESRSLLDHALRVIPLTAIQKDARAAAIRDVRLHSSADAVDRMLGAAPLPDADDLEELDGLARSESALNLLSTASSRMIALRVRGRMPRAVQLGVLVERFARIAAVHQPQLIAGRLPAALLQAGITRGLADDVKSALLTLRDAYERGEESRVAYVTRDAAGKSALFSALDGDVEQARVWLERHDRAPEADGWQRSRIELTVQVARALIATEGLRADQAAACVALLEQPVNAEQSWGPAVSYARARYALAWGDRLGALDALGTDRVRFADWLGEGTTLGPLLLQAAVDLHLSLHQRRRAGDLLNRHPEHALVEVMRARTALAEGDSASALRRTSAALTETLSSRARVDLLITRVVAMAQQGRPEAAADQSSDIVAAVRERGLLFPILAAPPNIRGLFDGILPDAHGARETLPTDNQHVQITRQQQSVLVGLEKGLSVREMAAQSHLSANTVKTHVRGLYRRLEVSTRDEAVSRAYEVGLL